MAVPSRRTGTIAAGIAAMATGVLAPTPGNAQPGPPASLALVIDNADYTALPRLPACLMSGNLAAASLTRAGFRVTQLHNPSNARMGTAIATLGDDAAARPDSRAVIYYCGYMASYADRAFVLPAEARLERETDVLTQGIVARLLASSTLGSASTAGLLAMDLALRPGVAEATGLTALSRPGDAAKGGIAAMALPGSGDAGAGPMAGALADMLRSGPVDLAKALADLPTQPALSRFRMLALTAPTQPTWLVGGPAPPVATPPRPAPDAPPVPVPSPAAEPTPADRRRIQVALQKLGYFRGRVTGAFGADTLAAIRRFQAESGEDASGTLTPAQAGRLLDR